MNIYKGADSKKILAMLLKKAREHNLSICVLFSSLNKAKECSDYVWNQQILCVPHGLNDQDPDQNVVFSLQALKKDMLIIFEEAALVDNLNDYQKIVIIGTHHIIDGNYWCLENNVWKKVDKNNFYS